MAVKNQQAPLIQHDSTSVPPMTDPSAQPALSSSLSDMELEIDIELTGPGDSPPIMPAPGEDPMLPLPPTEPIPPKSNAVGLHRPSISLLRDAKGTDRAIHRSLPQGKEGLLRQRSRKRADAVSSPNGAGTVAFMSRHVEARETMEEPLESPFLPPQHDAWSKKQICEHSVKSRLQKRQIAQTNAEPKQTEHRSFSFDRLPMSPSKDTARGDLNTKASKAEFGVTEERGPMTRFLPPNKEEAFIGFMPGSAKKADLLATIDMIKRECPSLTAVPSDHLSLALHFDGSPSWVKDVLFRVPPEAWPAAVTDTLPLIHVKHHPAVGLRSDVTPEASLLSEQIRAGRAEETRKVSDEDLLGAFESEGNNAAWKANSGMLDKGTQVDVGEQNIQAKRKEEKTWDQLVEEGVSLGIH